MTTKNPPTKTPSHLPPPPSPEGKPFPVGATTALVSTNADKTVTLRLKRVIHAPPEKIYKAFLDPDALAAWFPPHGFVARTHELDARVGGKVRFTFYTLSKSWSSTSSGTYLELVPNRRIVSTSRFETDDPTQRSQMRLTVTLTPVEEGTLVEIENAGIPAGPSASGAPYGWSQSLDKLAQLVEPELPF
jgi:uncharacterized protein YndB with AHSA1/START domain